MIWLLVFPAGIIGGLGVSGIIRIAFIDNKWAARLSWPLMGRQPWSQVSGVGPAFAGTLGVTLCLISTALDLADVGVGITAVISGVIGYVLHKWLWHRTALLAVLSFPLSVVLLFF